MTRRVRAKTVSLLVLAALLSGLSSRAVIGAAVIQADSVRYVSPSGSDANDGSADRPLKTIQKALDNSEPGGVIQLAPGALRPGLRDRAGRRDHLRAGGRHRGRGWRLPDRPGQTR